MNRRGFYGNSTEREAYTQPSWNASRLTPMIGASKFYEKLKNSAIGLAIFIQILEIFLARISKIGVQ